MAMLRTSTFMVAALVALVALGACAPWDTDVKVERGLTAPDTAFRDGLQYEYAYFSVKEKSDVDKTDADWFEGRAGDSAADYHFLPEPVPNRELTETWVPVFDKVRARLVAAMDNGGREKYPYIAAHAQAMFDCWIEEQEENRQAIDISVCRRELIRALDKMDPLVELADVAPPPPPPVAAILAGPFFVYFDHDKDLVDDTANEPLQKTLQAHELFPNASVFVRGHTDLTGTLEYNVDLAKRRSENVTRALEGVGIPGTIIQKESFGEELPKVPTNEEDRLRTNRRVEIWLSG